MVEGNPAKPNRDREVDISQLSSLVEIETDSYEKATANYREYPLDKLTVNQHLPVDLFIPMLDKIKERVFMYKVFSKDKPLLSKDKNYLINMGVNRFFVHNSQFANYVAYKNQHAHRILNKPHLSPIAKSELLYDNATLIIEHAMSDERLGENVKLGVTYIKELTNFIAANPDNIRSISTILSVDYSLYTHSVNVCLLLTSFTHYLGLPKEHIITLGVGALYHDIGKRKIPVEILNKPDRLDDDEWEVMKKHPTYGYNMLRNSTRLDPLVMKMAYHHHENLDGSGYPGGRNGDQLDASARILKIVDVYDALTSRRVYKDAMDPKQAITMMARNMSNHMSKDLLKQYTAFLGWMVSGPLSQAKIKRAAQTD